MRILILGGTTEARLLAEDLAGRPDLAPVLSLAGRTARPLPPAIPHRIGGFGGAAGLAAYLREHRVEKVIDATHPFAERISANAEAACGSAGIPLLCYTRPGWQAGPGDRWTEVAGAPEAAEAIGEAPRRVFLTVGRLQLPAFAAAPRHDYLIRSIDPPDPPPDLPRHRLLLARGPFTQESETRLMREERIEFLVTKNSGGEATRAKLDAARELGLQVILIRRPAVGAAPAVHTLDAVLAWIHDAAPEERGV